MQQFELPATNDVRGRGILSVWLDDGGKVEQVWSIQRLTPIEFRVVGDTLGVVCKLEGPAFGEWVAPINPATGRPYFKARTKDVLDALEDLSGLVRFATGGVAKLVGSKVVSDVNASRDWGGVSPQLDLDDAGHAAPPAAQPPNAGSLELCVEIGGFEGVTVRVDGIAPADFDAVCQSVRAAFLANAA